MAGIKAFFQSVRLAPLALTLTLSLVTADTLIFRPHDSLGSVVHAGGSDSRQASDGNQGDGVPSNGGEAAAWDKPKFCRSLDCPRYKVVTKTDDYEERQYEVSSWVSTSSVNIDYKKAQYSDFMKLFRYISGGNVAKKKIAMTVPVINRIIPGEGPACEDNFTMSFFVAEDQAPAPTEEGVFLSSLPAQTVYVKSFGGYASKEKYLTAAQELAAKLPPSAKYHTDFWYTGGYDSPWQFFSRHNEVWFIGK